MHPEELHRAPSIGKPVGRRIAIIARTRSQFLLAPICSTGVFCMAPNELRRCGTPPAATAAALARAAKWGACLKVGSQPVQTWMTCAGCFCRRRSMVKMPCVEVINEQQEIAVRHLDLRRHPGVRWEGDPLASWGDLRPKLPAIVGKGRYRWCRHRSGLLRETASSRFPEFRLQTGQMLSAWFVKRRKIALFDR